MKKVRQIKSFVGNVAFTIFNNLRPYFGNFIEEGKTNLAQSSYFLLRNTTIALSIIVACFLT